MSALRTRMIEDMQLAGLSAKTQEVYLQAVCVHQIKMSLFLPFRNVTPQWSGSGGRRARSPGVAERPNDARGTAVETAPFVLPSERRSLGS